MHFHLIAVWFHLKPCTKKRGTALADQRERRIKNLISLRSTAFVTILFANWLVHAYKCPVINHLIMFFLKKERPYNPEITQPSKVTNYPHPPSRWSLCLQVSVRIVQFTGTIFKFHNQMHNLRKKICFQKDRRYLDHNNFPSLYIWYSYVYSDVVNAKTLERSP